MTRNNPALIVLVVCTASAQTGRFEIADVHISPPTVNYHHRNMSGGDLFDDRYLLRRATMLDLISTAWDVDSAKVLGGPSWLDMDRFDLQAKTPPGTTPQQLRPMLQALLADRFGLVIHEDTKPVPGWALTAGKTPKLKASDGSGQPTCLVNAENNSAGGVISASSTISYSCHAMTMAGFAARVMYIPGSYTDEIPITDRTGLTGTWDFTFKYTPRSNTAAASRITEFDALEQIGLALEPAMIPAPVLVVDRVNQKPTENSPEVSKVFPAVSVEFEAAAIKRSAPGPHTLEAYNGALDTRVQYLPGGRLNAQANLHGLIRWIWGLGDPLISGMPSFAEDDSWDITAKAADPNIDSDTQNEMLINLLVTRFKLAFHYEERVIAGYNLISLKPKLKKADPTARTGCKEGPATPMKADPRDVNPIRGRLLTCQNTSMSQFAYLLFRGMAAGYVGSPVMDATGIEGSWDFTLNFSAPALVKGVDPSAADPTGAISLLDAMEKQIGVKLEMQKHPARVLVIDHLERTPTEN